MSRTVVALLFLILGFLSVLFLQAGTVSSDKDQRFASCQIFETAPFILHT